MRSHALPSFVRSVLRSGLVTAVTIVTIADANAAPRGVPMVPCQGGIVSLRTGSELDYGWTGDSHDDELPAGPSFSFAVVRRCADSDAVCTADADCGDSDCVATCDCSSDTTCEISGPIGQGRCITTLEECTIAADCPDSVPCVHFAGAPIPLADSGVPTCTLSTFESSLAGTADMASGEMDLSATLRWRVFLGNAVDAPCPRCGSPMDNPRIGDSFQCEGGQFDGQDCKVDGVTAEFGGTSLDCPPGVGSNISGAGLVIRLDEVTTQTTARTATLPCTQIGLNSNPLNAPANPGKCIDDMTDCSSNADCKRCTNDVSTSCSSNADCTGEGSCSEAPDQPISCGYWCACGFCDGNASLPCFDSGQCPEGQLCVVGSGSPSAANAPQRQPNDCTNDGFVCGEAESEQCATTQVSHCSDRPSLPCTFDEDCAADDAGSCVFEPRPCFESRISRTGSVSPLGSYCAFGATPCNSNADCAIETDFCVSDSLVPRLASLFCSGATSSGLINAVSGITGPAAMGLETLIQMCRCGDGSSGCEDLCSTLLPCLSAEDGTPCNDGNICTQGETCSDGECGTGTPTSCDDGIFCNGSETCSPPVGCIAGPAACDDGNPCTDDTCNEDDDSCESDDNAGACNDGVFCNGSDTCDAGTCSLHAGDPCPGPDGDGDCSESCDEAADACSGDDADETACSDGNSCTVGDECSDGSCTPGAIEDPQCVPTTTLPEGPVCGDWTGDGELAASDAAGVLRAAVGIHLCELFVCDYNGSGDITAVDALAVLRAAVELPTEPNCPDAG